MFVSKDCQEFLLLLLNALHDELKQQRPAPLRCSSNLRTEQLDTAAIERNSTVSTSDDYDDDDDDDDDDDSCYSSTNANDDLNV